MKSEKCKLEQSSEKSCRMHHLGSQCSSATLGPECRWGMRIITTLGNNGFERLVKMEQVFEMSNKVFQCPLLLFGLVEEWWQDLPRFWNLRINQSGCGLAERRCLRQWLSIVIQNFWSFFFFCSITDKYKLIVPKSTLSSTEKRFTGAASKTWNNIPSFHQRIDLSCQFKKIP